MKKLKIIIIIFIITIIVIIAGIVLLNNNKTESLGDIQSVEEIPIHTKEIEEENPLDDTVKDSEAFFTVSSCVSQYLDLLNKNYQIYYGYDDNDNYTQIVNPYEVILEVLSEKYVKENNISKDNLQNYIQLMEDKVMFIPLKMRVIENEEVEKYLVYGIVENLDNEYIEDIYLFVNLDGNNATFSIEPIENKYNNIFDIEFTNEESARKLNDFNEYVPIEVDNEYMCKQYFYLYKSIALAKPEMAYQFLDKNYSQQRFGDVSSYIKYLKDNQEELKTLELTQYLVNGYEEYTEYVCKDKYENLYVFNEKMLMDFTMKLDTYTIPTNNFIEAYKVANNQKRVMMNIDKWVQMLNTRDYTSAYEVLNETFRNHTFGSEEQFTAYIKQNYPLHYKIQFSDFSEEGTTYVQHITLTDITSESQEEKQLDIIMKLGEDIDFVMSFNVQ